MTLLRPQDIRARVEKLWTSQRLLRAWLSAEPLFPFEVPLSPPAGSALIERFAEVQAWIAALRAEAREVKGHGYTLVEHHVAHRQLGPQRVPVRAVVPTLEDGLRLIGKSRAFQRFEALAQDTRLRLPGLEGFMRARPLTLLQHEADWRRVLDVCAHLVARPRPGCYVRELDVAGVDTKFIQRHQSLLTDMLRALLPAEAQDEAVSRSEPHAFERRFGLRHDPAVVRFRLLDPDLAVGGFSDLSVPLTELARWPAPGVETVFVTENKVNGLAFPATPGAIVIFGLGYGVRALGELPWLASRRVLYWGDLDTHGFAILAALRERWPHVESLLMDEETLLTHRRAWGQEDATRALADQPQLRESERDVFDGLRQDRWGERVRLEQERLAYGWVKQSVEALAR